MSEPNGKPVFIASANRRTRSREDHPGIDPIGLARLGARAMHRGGSGLTLAIEGLQTPDTKPDVIVERPLPPSPSESPISEVHQAAVNEQIGPNSGKVQIK